MIKINLRKIIIFIILSLILFHTSISLSINSSTIDRFDEVLIALIMALSIINVIKKKDIKRDALIISFGTILFSLSGVLSCYINSEFILSRVLLSCFLSIKFFILVISLINLNFTDKFMEDVISCLEIITKVVIVVAIFNFLFPTIYSNLFPFAKVMKRFGLISVTSLFYHPGKYGWFMLFMSILYYSKYKANNDKKDKRNMIICGLLSLLSFRTKVIIGLVVLFLTANILNKKIKLKNVIFSIIIAISIFFIFNNIITNTYNLYFADTESVSARQALNRTSLKIMKDYFPFGVGFGKYGSWFSKIYYSEYYSIYNIDNIYGISTEHSNFIVDVFWPSIAGESGFVGVVIYILIIVLIFKLINYRLKSNDIPKIKYIYCTLAKYALIQSICESFGEQSFNSSPQNIFLAFVIGLSLCNVKLTKYDNKECN